MSAATGRVPLREIARLAGPALPVLAAEPLYLLVDTAVVGRLGAVPLAGLAVAGVVFAQVTSQLNFLSYGTTARAARLHGAGRRSAAVGEGVQATWLALAVGLLVLGVGQLVAGPVTRVLGDGGAVAAAAESWLRMALWGAPLVLVTLAGNGWMRGVQDTARPLRYVLAGNGLSALLCVPLVHGLGMVGGLGLVGSAVANLAGQAVGAGLFLHALHRERAVAAALDPVSLRPVPVLLRAQLAMGRDLLARSLAFQACFLSAAAVAARSPGGMKLSHSLGPSGSEAGLIFIPPSASVAAHQVVLQLWFFMALVLDAIAIAAQSLVGAALGSGDVRRARALARQVAVYGLVLGSGFGVLFAGLAGVLPRLFTGDPAVLAAIPAAWWFFAGMQPLTGTVFALDGVLLGAGDAAYLRTWTLVAAAAGFLPLTWASLVFGWGLVGVWTGLTAFVVIRLVAVLLRVRSGRWAVTGAVRA
jgi:Na+-driven multidrug efflux pump